MPWRLLILDDDPVRLSAFDGGLHLFPGDWRIKAWVDAGSMLDELDEVLPEAEFISLDASLAPPVVERLAMRKPRCPVSLHWRYRSRDVAWRCFRRLTSAGWDVELIQYFNESWSRTHWLKDWQREWLRAVRELLLARSDKKANRVHAANCERLRSRFEGREAIYVEKYVRRVKVWGIRAHVDARHVRAMAEEIITPGLGAPIAAGLPSWWRFGGGYLSRFSPESWSTSVQFVSWDLYFAPDFINAVVQLAATLPSEEVYRSERLAKLVFDQGGAFIRGQERIFPD